MAEPIALADDGRDPWDRQVGETARMHAHFTHYLDSPRHHRYSKRIAEELNLSPRSVQEYAWRYRWTERAQAFDTRQREIAEAELAEERRKMITRHLQGTRAMFGKWAKALAAFDAGQLSGAELARWLEVITKAERAALGEPDRVAVQGTPEGPPITLAAATDEPARMEQLRATVARLVPDVEALGELDPADLEQDEESEGGRWQG